LSTEAPDRRPQRPGEALLQHLPAVYHEAPQLRELLGAFEEVLLGPGEHGAPGLEQRIAALPELLDAETLYRSGERERREFLPWLAQWVALGDLPGLNHEQLSRLIPRIVPWYASRGTRGHLEALLALLLPELNAEVDDQELPTLMVGASRVGRETRLGGDLPFWFVVRLRPRTGTLAEEQRARLSTLARAVTDMAKPAFAAYRLEWDETPE
jgi:phage tail-like protein